MDVKKNGFRRPKKKCRLHIIETKPQIKRSPNFVKKTHAKIVYLHNYNCKVAQVCSIYPLDDDLKKLLVKYIELEMSILNNIEYNTDVYRLTLERRLLTLLSSIYSKYCFYIKGRFNPNDTWHLILELFEEVPYDVHKFFEDIRQKVINKINFDPEPLHTITVQSQLTCYKELDGTVKVEIDLASDPLLRCCEAFNIRPEVQELPVTMVFTDRLGHAAADRSLLECGDVIISDNNLTDTGQPSDTDVKEEFDMIFPIERLKSLQKQAMLVDKKPEIIDLCDEGQPQSGRDNKVVRQTNSIITTTNLSRNTVIDLLDSDDDDGCQKGSVCPSVEKTLAVSRKCDKSIDSVVNLIDDRCNENVISSLSSAIPERSSDSSNGDSHRDGRDDGACRTQNETEILRQIRELNLLTGSAEVIIKMIGNKLVITPKDHLNTSNVNNATEPQQSSDKILEIPSSSVNIDNIQPTIVDLYTEALSPRQQLVEELETNSTKIIQSNSKEDTSRSTLQNKLSVEAEPVNKNMQPTVVDLCTEALSPQQQLAKEIETNSTKIVQLNSKEDTSRSTLQNKLSVEAEPVNKNMQPTVVDLCTEALSPSQQFVGEVEETNTINSKLSESEDQDTSHSKTSLAVASKPANMPAVADICLDSMSIQQQSVADEKVTSNDIQPTVINSCTEPLSHQHQIVEVLEKINSTDYNSCEETVTRVSKPNEITSSVEFNQEPSMEIVDSTNEHTEIMVIYKNPIDSNIWTSSESFKSMYETEFEQETQMPFETTEEENTEKLVSNQPLQENPENILDPVVTEQTEQSLSFALVSLKSADEIFEEVTLRSLEQARRSRKDLEDDNNDIDESILLEGDEVVEDIHAIHEDRLLREKNDNLMDAEDNLVLSTGYCEENTSTLPQENVFTITETMNVDTHSYSPHQQSREELPISDGTEMLTTRLSSLTSSDSAKDLEETFSKDPQEISTEMEQIGIHEDISSKADLNQIIEKVPQDNELLSIEVPEAISSEADKLQLIEEVPQDNKSLSEEVPEDISSKTNKLQIIRKTSQDELLPQINEVLNELIQSEDMKTQKVLNNETITSAVATDIQQDGEPREDSIEAKDLCKKVVQSAEGIPEENTEIPLENTRTELTTRNKTEMESDVEDIQPVLSEARIKERIQKNINITSTITDHQEIQKLPKDKKLLLKIIENTQEYFGRGETLLQETQVSSDCREKVNIEEISIKSTESCSEDIEINAEKGIETVVDDKTKFVDKRAEIDVTNVRSENQINKEESSLEMDLEVPVHDKYNMKEPRKDDSGALSLQKQSAYLEAITVGSVENVEEPELIVGPVENVAGPTFTVQNVEGSALNEERAEIEAIRSFRNIERHEQLLYAPEPVKLTPEQMLILRNEETRARDDPRQILNAIEDATSETHELTDATDLRHVTDVTGLAQDRESLVETHEATDLRTVKGPPKDSQSLVESRGAADLQCVKEPLKDSRPLVATKEATDQQNVNVLPLEIHSPVISPEIQPGMEYTSVEKDAAKPSLVAIVTRPRKLRANQKTKKITKSRKDQKVGDISQTDTTNNETARKSEISSKKPVTESYEDNSRRADDLICRDGNKFTDLSKNSKSLNIEHAIEEVNEVLYEEGPVYLEECFVDNIVEVSTCEFYEETSEMESTNSNDNRVVLRDNNTYTRIVKKNSNSFDDDTVANEGRVMSEFTEKQTDQDAINEISSSKALPVVRNLKSEKLCPTKHVVSAGISNLEEIHSKGNETTKETTKSELNVTDKNDRLSNEAFKTSDTSDTLFSIYERPVIEELLEFMVHTVEKAEETQKDFNNPNVTESIQVAAVETSQAHSPEKSSDKSGRQDGEGNTSLDNQSACLETQPTDAVRNLDLSARNEEERAEAEDTSSVRDIEEVTILLLVPEQLVPEQPQYTKEQLVTLRNEETKPRDDPALFLNVIKNTTSGSEDNVLNLSNAKNKKTKNQTCSGSVLNLTSAKNDKDDGKSGNSRMGNDSQPLNLATNNNIGEKGSGSGLHDKNTSVSTKKHSGSQESEVVPDKQQDHDSEGQQNITDVNRMQLKPSDIPSAEKIASYLPKNGKKMENSSMVLYNADEDPLQDLRQSLSKYGTVVIPKTNNNQDLHLLADAALKHENINSDITDQGSDSEGLLLIDETCISPEYPEMQSEVVLGPSSGSYSGPNDFVLQIQNSYQTLLGSSSSNNRRKSPKLLNNSVTLYKGDNSEAMMPHRKILQKPIPRDYVHVQNYPEIISKSTNRRPNILKRKPKNILPVTDKKSYLQPKLILLTEEPKLPRPKTKAEKKQMPILEPSRACVRTDSDDDIPLSQRVKSRSPSPKKVKGRYGTTGIVIGRPGTNDIDRLEDNGIVKKTRSKSGDRSKNIRIENSIFSEEAPTMQVKSKTLEKFPGGRPLGKKARRKLGETNKLPEKLTPMLTERRKSSENCVVKPGVPDVYPKLIDSLENHHENNKGETRKNYRSKLRPRSCSGSEVSIDNSSVPAVELVSETVEPIGLYVEVKSTELGKKGPPKRLPGRIRQRSATVDDEDVFVVVDNNNPVPDKTSIAPPKPDADKASYVAKLRRKSGPESNIESHNLLDLESADTESGSKSGKRTGSPRTKKEMKLPNDTFDQEVIPTVKVSRGRGRGRGRGRNSRLNEKGSNKSKTVKKNLANRNFIPINDLTPGIEYSVTLTSPRKPGKKPNLKLDLNQTIKPSSSKPLVTLNTAPEIKESMQSPPLASSVPSVTTPKERFKREFKAQVESGKFDVLTPKSSASIADEEKGLNKNQISESKLPNQDNLVVEIPKIQSNDNDVKKVGHPKLRRKSLFSHCKNPVLEATTMKLFKKLKDESDKEIVGKHNKDEDMSELSNQLRVEDDTKNIVANRELCGDNTMENRSFSLAEFKPSENPESTSDVIKETHQKTVAVKITDQPKNQPDTVLPENLTQIKSVPNEENLQERLLVGDKSEDKLLLKDATTVEGSQVLENCEKIIPKLLEVKENDSVVRNAPLVNIDNSSTPLVTEVLGSKNSTDEILNKTEKELQTVECKPVSCSETNINISQDDSMLDDLPLSELKNITLNSKKTQQNLEIPAFPCEPTCHKTSKHKKRVDQKLEGNLELDDIKIVSESAEKVKTIIQESSLDSKLKLKPQVTIVKDTPINDYQQHIEPSSLDQKFEQEKTENTDQPSVEEIVKESSSAQNGEEQLSETPVSVFATSDVQSTNISDTQSNAATIETSKLVDNQQNGQKYITEVAKMCSDEGNIEGAESSFLEPTLETDIPVEIDVTKDNQSETFLDQENVKPFGKKEIAVGETVKLTIETSAERPLDGIQQTDHDESTAPLENQDIEMSLASNSNTPLKAPQKETIQLSTTTVDCQFATISVLAENSLSKTNDSNDFDLVSIAQEAAKHACENFEEQGTYFDDSGSVVREDIHISIGSEVEVTDTFTGDKEKEHLEIQDKLLHLLHDNIESETLEMSQEQAKAKTKDIGASSEKSNLIRTKKEVANKSGDQSVSTGKERKGVPKKVPPEVKLEKCTPSQENLNLTLDDDSDSEVEMKNKYLDKSKRKDRDLKQDKHKKARYEKPKPIAETDWKKSNSEKHRDNEFKNDKYTNKRRSSRQSRSEERDSRSSSRRGRSESNSSITSTSSISKSAVDRDIKRYKDRGRYSKSATTVSNRDKYNDRRSHNFPSRGDRYDTSRDRSNRTEEKNKDKRHKDIEKNANKYEKPRFNNNSKDKYKDNKEETSRHTRVDKNVNDRSKEDTQKGKKDNRGGTRRTKSNDHKDREAGVQLKGSKSSDRSCKDDKGKQGRPNTTEVKKNNDKNIRETCKEGLFILLNRNSILQSYCDPLSKTEHCTNQIIDQKLTGKKEVKKLEETKVEKGIAEEQKSSSRKNTERNKRKEITLKPTEHKEEKLNVKFHKKDSTKDVTLSNKNITSVDDGSPSEKEVPSEKEKTQTRDTIELNVLSSSSSILEVFSNDDKGDNNDVTDLLHVLEANDDDNNKFKYTPKDTRSSQTLVTVTGKRKSIESDDSIIETTPVQPKKKMKTKRPSHQKFLTAESKQCDGAIPDRSINESKIKETKEKPVGPTVQEPDSLVKEVIETVCEVQECVKKIEELVIATDIRETAYNVPGKERNIFGIEHPESCDSNTFILENEDKTMDSIDDGSDKIKNDEVDTLEKENKKIMDSLSAGTSGKIDASFIKYNTNEIIKIQENSLTFTEQKEDIKFSLPEGFVQNKQQLSDNGCVQESNVIKEETDSKPGQLFKDDICTTTQNDDNPNKKTEEVSNTVKEVKMPKAEIKKEPVLSIPGRQHSRTRVLAPRKNPSQPARPKNTYAKNVLKQPLAPVPIIIPDISIKAKVNSGQLPELVFLNDKSINVAKTQPECKTDIISAEKKESHEFLSSEFLATENTIFNEPNAQKVTKGRPFQLTTDGEKIPITVPQKSFVSNSGNVERDQKRARDEDFSEQNDQSAKKLSVTQQSAQVTSPSFEPIKIYNDGETVPIISSLQAVQAAQKHNETDDSPAEPQTVVKDDGTSDAQKNSLLADLELRDDVPYFELSLVTEVTDRLACSQERNGHGVENVGLPSQNSDKPRKPILDLQQKQDLKTSQQIINETFAQYLGSSDLNPNLQNPITISQILRESVASDGIEAAQMKQNTNESIKNSPTVNEDMFLQIPNYYRNPSPPETTNSSHLPNLDFRNPSPPVTSSLNSLPVLESFGKNIDLDSYHVGSNTLERPQTIPVFVENKDVNTFFDESHNAIQSNVGGTSSLSYTSNHIPTNIQDTEVRYQQIYGNNFQNNLAASNVHSPYMSDLSPPVTFYNQQTINASTVSSVSKNIATGSTQCGQTLPGYLHNLKDAAFSKIKSEKESEFTRDKERSDIISSNVKFLEEYPCASPEQVLPNFNRNETFKASPASTISQHSEYTSSVSQHSENTRDTVDVNSVSGSFQKGDHTYPKDVLMNWHKEDKNELNQNPTGEYVKPITEYDMDELEFDLGLIDESSTPATGIFRHSSSIPTDGVWPFGVEPDNPNKILTAWDESSKVVVEAQPQDYSTYYPDFSCLNNSLAGDITELSQGSESSDLERGNIDLTDWFNVSDTTEMLSEEMGLEESMTQDSKQKNKGINTTVEEIKTSKPEGKKKLPAPRKNTSAASKIEKENSISSQPESKKTEEVTRETKPEQLPHLVPLSGVTTRSASKRDARETYVTPETQSMHNLRVKSIGDLKHETIKPTTDNLASLNKTLVLTNGVPGGVFTVNALLMKTNTSQPRTKTKSTNVTNPQISLGSSKDSALPSRIFTRATALGEALKQQQMTSVPVSSYNSPQVSSEQSRMVTRVATIGLPADALKQKQLAISKHDIKGKTVHFKVVNPTFFKIINPSVKNTVESTTAPPLVSLQLENHAKGPLNEPVEVGQTSDDNRSLLNTYVNKKTSTAGNIKKSAPTKQEVKSNSKKSLTIKSPENTLLFETRTMTKRVKEALSQTVKRPCAGEIATDAKKPCIRSPASDPFDDLVRSPVSQVFRNADCKSDVKERDSKAAQSKNGPHQPGLNEPVPSGHQSRSGVQQQNPNEAQTDHRQNLKVHPLGQTRSADYQHSPKEPRSVSSQHRPKEVTLPPARSRYHNSVSPGHQSRSGSHQRPSRDTAPPGGHYTQGGSDYRGYTEKRHTAHAERSRSAGSRWDSKSPNFNERGGDKGSSKHSLLEARSKSDYCKSPNGTLLFPELPHKIKRSPGDDPSGSNGIQIQSESKQNESPNEPGQDGTPNKPESHEWWDLIIPKVDPEWLLPTQRSNASSGNSK